MQSVAEIARREGVTTQTIWLWRKRGVDVEDPEAVKRWRSEHGRGGIRLLGTTAENRRNGPPCAAKAPPTHFDAPDHHLPTRRLGSLTEETTRLAAARADWQALRNAEKAGNLISRERHERMLRESWLPVVERLNDLPTRYGSRFGADLAANMALLAEISRELKALAKGGNHD